jgi:hypothetical protein
LADQKVSGSMQEQDGLLLRCLDRHKAHARPRHRLANCLRISGIILLGLDVRFDELRWHQAYVMTECLDLTGPEVTCVTCFDPNESRRELSEKPQHIAPA